MCFLQLSAPAPISGRGGLQIAKGRDATSGHVWLETLGVSTRCQVQMEGRTGDLQYKLQKSLVD